MNIEGIQKKGKVTWHLLVSALMRTALNLPITGSSDS